VKVLNGHCDARIGSDAIDVDPIFPFTGGGLIAAGQTVG